MHGATATPEIEIGRELGEFQTSQSPLREIVYPPPSASHSTDPITLPPRNPFLFRTRFDLPTIPLPSLSSFTFRRKKDCRPPLDRGMPLDSLPSVVNGHLWESNSPAQPPRNQTFVWADAEDAPTPDLITSDTRLLVPMSSTYSVTTEPLEETYRR
jgi:pheromone a factor receptor